MADGLEILDGFIGLHDSADDNSIVSDIRDV